MAGKPGPDTITTEKTACANVPAVGSMRDEQDSLRTERKQSDVPLEKANPERFCARQESFLLVDYVKAPRRHLAPEVRKLNQSEILLH